MADNITINTTGNVSMFEPFPCNKLTVAPVETKCEECGKPLVAGDAIVYTEDMDRMWHSACFDATLLPVDQWPVEKKR